MDICVAAVPGYEPESPVLQVVSWEAGQYLRHFFCMLGRVAQQECALPSAWLLLHPLQGHGLQPSQPVCFPVADALA